MNFIIKNWCKSQRTLRISLYNCGNSNISDYKWKCLRQSGNGYPQ